MANIFIVDDSALTRAAVNKTLSGVGFEVIPCISGPDCLEKVSSFEEKIHLFILDVNMPEMDGIRLLRELRGLKKTKFTPILMLTTECSDEKKLEGKEAGASGWFVKPFNPEQLIKISQRFAGRSLRTSKTTKKSSSKETKTGGASD